MAPGRRPPLDRAYAGLRAVTRVYAATHNVQIVRYECRGTPPWSGPPDRPDDFHEHPSYRGLGYSVSQRAIFVPMRVWEYDPELLPHEVTHVFWPEDTTDPTDEWTTGMISYELAVLNRLAAKCRGARGVRGHLTLYASDGAPTTRGALGAATKRAKAVARAQGLPWPWPVKPETLNTQVDS